MLESTTTLLATHISNPWTESKRTHETRNVASAAAAPSRILQSHPQVWIHAAQPSGVRWERHSTASPLIRANLLLRSTACIIQTNVPSASPRSGMLRNLYRLLVRSSAYAIYHHRARARVINYWHQGADVLTVSLPTTPSERTRKNGPLQPGHAIWSPLIFAQNCKLVEGI
jgi:hypothetical protein